MKSGFGLLLLMLLLASCGLETAHSDKSQKLVIASDFLYPKDSVLFKNFTKKRKIRICVEHLSADSIQKRLAKEGYNSTFDLVFVKSLIGVRALEKTKFQRFSKSNLKENLDNLKAFHHREWLVLGLDPYLFSFVPDTLEYPDTYKQLTQKYNWATPNIDELDVLLIHAKQQLKKGKKYNYKVWRKGFFKNNLPFVAGNDSTLSRQFLVLKNSTFQKDSLFEKARKKRELIYPNQNVGGGYADRVCAAIVFQAKDYANANALLQFMNSREVIYYFNLRNRFINYPRKNGRIDGSKMLLISEDKLLRLL